MKDDPMARYHSLPNLTEIARSQPSGNPLKEEERLKQEYNGRKIPYRLSVVHAGAASPCLTGEHGIPTVTHYLIKAGEDRVSLTQMEFHQAEEHGGRLKPEVQDWLRKNVEGPTVESRAAPPNPEIEVCPLKKSYRAHGPVELVVKVVNKSSQPVDLPDFQHPLEGRAREADGSAMKVLGFEIYELSSGMRFRVAAQQPAVPKAGEKLSGPRTLAPGDAWSIPVDLRAWGFDLAPGRYEVTAIWNLPRLPEHSPALGPISKSVSPSLVFLCITPAFFWVGPK